MMDWTDIALRLAAATAIGMVLGLNRDLHGKPTGMRTLGLVGLGASLAVTAVIDPSIAPSDALNAVSRVVQGILTGIGFLGAGVIVRGSGEARVRGADHGGLYLAHRQPRHRLRGRRLDRHRHRPAAAVLRAFGRWPDREDDPGPLRQAERGRCVWPRAGTVALPSHRLRSRPVTSLRRTLRHLLRRLPDRLDRLDGAPNRQPCLRTGVRHGPGLNTRPTHPSSFANTLRSQDDGSPGRSPAMTSESTARAMPHHRIFSTKRDLCIP